MQFTNLTVVLWFSDMIDKNLIGFNYAVTL